MIPIVVNNVAREAQVMTDSGMIHKGMNKDGCFASHDRVDHSEKEYARYELGPVVIHTNTVEGYFSVFKRGMRGTYQHCGEKHLNRTLPSSTSGTTTGRFRVDDNQRAARALEGVK